MTHASREEYRAELLGRVPVRYSPVLHLLGPSLVAVAVMVLALLALRDVRAWQLALVPVFLLAGNAAEWHAHRGLLHRRTRFLEAFYVRHTPQHHHLYVADDLAIRSVRELRFVLMPPHAMLFVLALATPVAIAFAAAGLRNLAALWIASTALYVLAYEWLHMAYHLPPESAIGRLRIVNALRPYHQAHHAPHLMNQRNFNVTVPLWDAVRGTLQRRAPSPVAPVAAPRTVR